MCSVYDNRSHSFLVHGRDVAGTASRHMTDSKYGRNRKSSRSTFSRTSYIALKSVASPFKEDTAILIEA